LWHGYAFIGVHTTPFVGRFRWVYDINAAIAPLSITADGLAQLGFQHIGTEKAAKLYRASDWPAIREALSDRARTAIINPLRKAA